MGEQFYDCVVAHQATRDKKGRLSDSFICLQLFSVQVGYLNLWTVIDVDV